MNKQIEEMARVIEEASCGYGVDGCHRCEFDGKEEFSCAEMRIAKALYNAGYRKQIEGEWADKNVFFAIFKCSICGEENSYKDGRAFLSNFCPNCGAKMRVATDNNVGHK